MVRVLISSPLDVTDERNCVGVADTVRNEYGPLDILINNAGIGHVGTIEATAGADLDRLYAVNVRGVLMSQKPLWRYTTRGSMIRGIKVPTKNPHVRGIWRGRTGRASYT